MKSKISLLLILLAVLLGGCRPDPNEQYIQGEWEMVQPDENLRTLRWTFDNGQFTRELIMAGQSPLFTGGDYRIIESAGDVLIIELDNFTGSRMSYENNPMTVKIEIQREKGTIQITNTEFMPAGY